MRSNKALITIFLIVFIDLLGFGGTLGFLQSAGSLGRILGPIIGGELFYYFGKDTPFLFASIILFLVFLSNLKLKDK